MSDSAGLLVHRVRGDRLEVLIVHPGGPFWNHRDAGAWSIPKGGLDAGEEPLAAARREFREELGIAPPDGEPIDLGEIRQRGGKRVRAFAVDGGAGFDVTEVRSNTFEMEWPPRSGRIREFPEVDRAGWFALPDARTRLIAAQGELLDRLVAVLGAAAPNGDRPAAGAPGPAQAAESESGSESSA